MASVAVGDGEAEGERVGEAVGLSVAEGVALTDGVRLAVGVSEGNGLGVAEAVGDAVREGVGDCVGDAVGVDVTQGFAEGSGETPRLVKVSEGVLSQVALGSYVSERFVSPLRISGLRRRVASAVATPFTDQDVPGSVPDWPMESTMPDGETRARASSG